MQATQGGDDPAQGVGYDLVVVGTSWGGLAALRTLVAGLPETFSMALVLIQHRHKDSDHLLRVLLQERSALEVCEVEDKMLLEHGRIYVAPPDYHTLVEPGHFSLSTEAPVRYSRPSIDVLFESAADAYGPSSVAVLLTGANDDGCRGVCEVKRRGGLTLVQDPCTAVRRAMPDAAIATGAVDKVLTLDQIATLLNELGRPT